MKVPKVTNRHCPFCNKHAEHKVMQAKRRARNQTRPLSAFSDKRVKARGLRRGAGNLGKFSKPPIAKWKSTGKKVTKKTDFRYECSICKKQHMQSKGIRAKKVELV